MGIQWGKLKNTNLSIHFTHNLVWLLNFKIWEPNWKELIKLSMKNDISVYPSRSGRDDKTILATKRQFKGKFVTFLGLGTELQHKV